MENLFSIWRLKAYSVSVTIALLISIVVGSLLGQARGGLLGMRTGGDYVSFYAAGKIIMDGRGRELYDPKVQAEYQKGLGVDLDGKSVQYFPYPIFFAICFVPLALLPLSLSYLTYAAISILLVFLAASYVARLLNIADQRSDVFIFMLSFCPTMLAILAGQNSCISMFLLSAGIYYFSIERQLKAGVILGLFSFKPQIEVAFLLLMLLRREAKATLGLLLCGATLYLLGSLVGGLSWPLTWINALKYFAPLESMANMKNFASVIGGLQAIFGVSGTGAAFEFIIAAVAALILYKVAIQKELLFGKALTLIASGLPLFCLHFLYYDLALLSVCAPLLIPKRVYNPTLAILWIVSLSIAIGKLLVVPMSTLYAVVTIGVLLWKSSLLVKL